MFPQIKFTVRRAVLVVFKSAAVRLPNHSQNECYLIVEGIRRRRRRRRRRGRPRTRWLDAVENDLGLREMKVKRWRKTEDREAWANTMRKLRFSEDHETWININHTKSKIWICEDGDIPLNVPLGKGGRFIIVHAGPSSGFIPGAYHSFKSKSTNDPHEEMNALNKAPTSASSKSDMPSWLRQNNIEYDPKATKIVLYDIIKLKKEKMVSAIEFIWAQVKNDVAKHNVSFESSEVIKLFEEALSKVTPENWKNACEHIKKEEDFYWERDGMIDKAVDRFVISLDSDSDDDDGDDNMEVEVEESATAHTNSFMEGVRLLPPSPPQSSGQPLSE
ncbi:hypothetical protein ANN_19562 [Periplaneta americana]|uniref:Uncharacterized protein n=1 Tax=Periplaneta americana TaxID=6978 RepID=A0ABQ8SAT4_PERAM|nr:hypothetical protein ANN_19562 [Periplaneta americana]